MSTYTAVQYSPSMIGKLSESQKNVIENDTSGTDSTTNFNSDEAASSNSDGYPTGNATASESNKEEVCSILKRFSYPQVSRLKIHPIP